MAFPAPEPLFEHLSALRDATDPSDPSHDRRWREVATWLAAAYPGRHQEVEDARQEALIGLTRYVPTMRAETPLEAAKWVLTIVRRKRVDGIRVGTRDPVRQALRAEPSHTDRSLLELIAADEAPSDAAGMLERLITTVIEHVQAALEAAPPAKRLLRTTQARAALLRLVYDADAEAIAEALGHGEPLSRDRVYKWVERGRPVVVEGLDHWERSLAAEEREEAGPVIEALREIVLERRADAGKPRPARRKEGRS